MRKYVPLLLLPIVLVLGAAVLAPKLASEERLRDEALAVLRAATGQPARIGGAVSFSVLPWPSLAIEDLTMGDPAVGTLSTARLRIVLDLLPLLTGRARADHIELHAPELVLASQSGDIDAPDRLIAALGAGKLDADVGVVDGRVLIARDGGAAILVTAANLDLRWRGGREASLRGDIIWRGEPLSVDADLGNIGAIARGGAGNLAITVSGPPIELNFKGTTIFSGGPAAEGTVSIASRQARLMLAWLGFEVPTEDGFGPLALRARTQLSARGATLSDARIELDGNVGEGGFTLRLDGDRAIMQGSLASDMLDLSPYGELALSEPDDGDWSHAPIDLRRFRGLDIDLRLSATQVRAGAARLDRMAASAVLKGGKLSLAIGDASAWDGAFRAHANIAPSAGGAEARVELAGEDVALARALGDLFRFQRLEGRGSFRLTAVGSGASVATIVGGLGGSMKLESEQGALVGIDVPRILARLEQRPLSGAGDLRGGRTAYDRLALEATIKNGVAHLDQLSLDSSKMRISVRGDTSLATRDLDLAGTAQLIPAGANAAPFDLPFVVRGSWDRPLVLPDPQALIRRSGAARPLFGGKLDAIGVAAP